MVPIFAGFNQIAYVTTDLDRTCDIFARDYGIPKFFRKRVALDATFLGTKGVMDVEIGLANVDNVQIELIMPISGLVQIYSDALPKDGSFALRLHHVGVIVPGGQEDWKRCRSEIDRRGGKVAFEGGVENDIQFAYVDERHYLGVYVEHVWFAPGGMEKRKKIIPDYSGLR